MSVSLVVGWSIGPSHCPSLSVLTKYRTLPLTRHTDLYTKVPVLYTQAKIIFNSKSRSIFTESK